jgi:hypothetical protein
LIRYYLIVFSLTLMIIFFPKNKFESTFLIILNIVCLHLIYIKKFSDILNVIVSKISQIRIFVLFGPYKVLTFLDSKILNDVNFLFNNQKDIYFAFYFT